MGLIEKLETLINGLLFKLGAMMARLTPFFLKKYLQKLSLAFNRLIAFFKKLPASILEWGIIFLKKTQAKSKEINFKEKFSGFIEELKTKNSNEGKFKSFILIPFHIFSRWLQGLSPGQAILLLSLTAGSMLAIIGIGFSGKKIVRNQFDNGRFPASEEKLSYDRPDYYKKERRHATFSNLRLPVYFAEINEVKSVDIDFNVTLSNRSSRMFLEKHDFQLRDHLILQIEPSVASFPLEEEGKVIIKKKLHQEIDEFLRQHEIEGIVEEVDLTYILAN